MKLINNFLDLMGFQSTTDLLGVSLQVKPLIIPLISLGAVTSFIENFTGIHVYLWMFLTIASAFDILFGYITNVFFLKEGFVTRKFFRGVFKSFVVLSLILLTNTLKKGVELSDIQPEVLKTVADYVTSSMHYTFVLIIALYLLFGIVENGAKMEIPVFKSLSRILRIKIAKIEEVATEE